MAVLTGKSGAITFATGYDQHCNNWTIEISTDVFEDTELGDSWRTRVVGINEWSGSFDCALDEDSFSNLTAAGIGEAAASASFQYAGATGQISGSIVITGATINATTTGANSVSFTFVGSGIPTFT
jgi:hypothetical protein